MSNTEQQHLNCTLKAVKNNPQSYGVSAVPKGQMAVG